MGATILFSSPAWSWTYKKEAKSTNRVYIFSASGIKCLLLPAFSAIEVDYSMSGRGSYHLNIFELGYF